MKASFKTSLVFVLILLFFGAMTPLAAAGQNQAAAPTDKPSQPRFRMINDKNLKSFFGHSQRNLPGIEASVHTLYNIDVWLNYRIYSDETKTTFFANADKFRINAASIGLIYRPLIWKMLEPFVGLGLEIYSYSEKIEGGELPGTSGNAVGFHVQAGTYINITKFLAGKLFVRINGVKKTLSTALPDGTTSLDLGGKEFGVGLVARF